MTTEKQREKASGAQGEQRLLGRGSRLSDPARGSHWRKEGQQVQTKESGSRKRLAEALHTLTGPQVLKPSNHLQGPMGCCCLRAHQQTSAPPTRTAVPITDQEWSCAGAGKRTLRPLVSFFSLISLARLPVSWGGFPGGQRGREAERGREEGLAEGERVAALPRGLRTHIHT